MKQFNINDTVKVKLTEFGKQMLEQDHNEFWGSRGMLEKFPYTSPEEDENGYVKFQLWSLMGKLGRFCYMGCVNPFDTVILIDENNLRDVE
jgi:hypothetical protein